MFNLLKTLLLPFVILSLCVAIVPFFIKIDILLLQNEMSEYSITELAQQLLLFLTVLIFAWSAKKMEQSRSFFVLVAGFFGCMFLRELDFYFDMIRHGFWLYPTLTLAVVCIWYSLKNNTHLAASAQSFKTSNAFPNVLLGLVLILVFSRLFGTESLWKDLMAENFLPLYKTIIQEGLELLGYLIVFVGACHQWLGLKHKP